uniref:Uncharacterized protein n=1 Tax=Haptolina ericina TaxID=156174 RepID=A0A7S3ASR9_9EUKA
MSRRRTPWTLRGCSDGMSNGRGRGWGSLLAAGRGRAGGREVAHSSEVPSAWNTRARSVGRLSQINTTAKYNARPIVPPTIQTRANVRQHVSSSAPALLTAAEVGEAGVSGLRCLMRLIVQRSVRKARHHTSARSDVSSSALTSRPLRRAPCDLELL